MLKFWDLKSASLATTLTGPDDSGYGDLTYSRDGSMLAVVDTDQDGNSRIQLWDLKTGKMMSRLPGHRNNISGLVFSLDGSVLATSSQDKTLVLWDVKTGSPLISLPSADNQGGFAGLALSPDGTLLASSNINGTLQLWAVGEN
jgi:WD40 repeat protein